MLKTNRNMWVLILLSLVTCGIYPLFYWAGVGEDVNKMCAADGKTTQNFWIAWLLGLITAGVFQLVWIYGVVERIYDAGKRYGVETKCTGSTYLIWALVGSLLCGVGPFIALYKHVNDINAVAAAYNAAGIAR